MARSLDTDFVENYAAGPSATTVESAISLHTNVRDVLGAGYATLLQGSYKNDTALRDMNDVDIVAVSTNLWSRAYGRQSTGTGKTWDEIFGEIERRLNAESHYRGKHNRKDKCIRLSTEVNIDIVPAVMVEDDKCDPISIYSFRDGGERKNWPRGHYQGGADKSGRTSGAYKKTVRLFKRWTKSHFSDAKIAPSYYVESLLHSMPDRHFTGDLAADFLALGQAILAKHPRHSSAELPRIHGEGDLLTSAEWTEANFHRFRDSLTSSLPHVDRALREIDQTRARADWRAAFNGQ